ncbi:MAG: hypothetical protein HOW97_32360 [Catenulispora sp.]|nr:hypothetical protein [Catenulispora sp.]
MEQDSFNQPMRTRSAVVPQTDPQQAVWQAPVPDVPKPTVRRRTAILGCTGALLLGVGIGSASGHDAKTDTATPAAVPQSVVTTTATPRGGAPAAAPVTVTATVTATPAAAAAPAPSSAAAPKSTVVFTTSGDGIKKTKTFTTSAEWSVSYTFDCANAGGNGNFILQVDGDLGDTLANALAAKGGDTSYVHDNPGDHYLSVNSECNWTLKVTNG